MTGGVCTRTMFSTAAMNAVIIHKVPFMTLPHMTATHLVGELRHCLALDCQLPVFLSHLALPSQKPHPASGLLQSQLPSSCLCLITRRHPGGHSGLQHLLSWNHLSPAQHQFGSPSLCRARATMEDLLGPGVCSLHCTK